MKNLINDLAVICNEIEDTPESGLINHCDGINYWVIAVVLLSVACLLLLVVIIVNYYLKCGLTNPCFSSY